MFAGLLALLGAATAAAGASSPEDRVAAERRLIEARVLSIRQALDKEAPDDATDEKVAQWYNWPNWGNWNNWQNWGNWGNWFNR